MVSSYELSARKRAFESLSADQVDAVLSNLEKMKRADIARLIGVPESRLKRAALHAKWRFSFSKGVAVKRYDQSTVKEVCEFYVRNGKRKTQEKYKGVRVRSIIERNLRGQFKRGRRWKGDELLELVKMAGIISFKNQAKYFNRPRANEGSIRSVWVKRFGQGQSCIHGLPAYKAKLFISKECPFVESGLGNGLKIFLWSDCVNHLRADCPDFVKEAVVAMGDFQKKLFGGDPRVEILKLIQERSW